MSSNPAVGVAALHNGDCNHPGLTCPYSLDDLGLAQPVTETTDRARIVAILNDSGSYESMEAVADAVLAVTETTDLRAALLMFGDYYDINGIQEWHGYNCTYRKTWVMYHDEPSDEFDTASCVAARKALGE